MSLLPPRAVITGAGAIASIGYCVPQIWASVRTSIARYSCPGPLDRHSAPIRMAVVNEEDLEPLIPENDVAGWSSRSRRMIRLAAPAIREATEGHTFSMPPPLFLGLPRPVEPSKPVPAAVMVAAVAKQANLPIDEKASQVFPAGGAAFFLALDQALRFLASGRGPSVLVGGVDTHYDLRVLANLEAEQRLLSDHVSDGLVPGEGAGFLVLSRATSLPTARATFIAGVGLASDSGHRYAEAPARGEGLWNAMNALFGATPLGSLQIQSTLAGLNGENFGSKEWGIARLRHTSSFAAACRLDHPADCYGDVGAATGGVLAALAHTALINRHREGPVLVWASSDHEERGCTIIDISKS